MNTKLIASFILLLFFSVSGFTQSNFVPTNEIVRKAQETSLYTKNVDWKKVDTKFINISNFFKGPK